MLANCHIQKRQCLFLTTSLFIHFVVPQYQYYIKRHYTQTRLFSTQANLLIIPFSRYYSPLSILYSTVPNCLLFSCYYYCPRGRVEIGITTPSWEDLTRYLISTSLLINSAWETAQNAHLPSWIALKEGKSIRNGMQQQQLAKRRDGVTWKEPKNILPFSTVNEESEGRPVSLSLTMWHTI